MTTSLPAAVRPHAQSTATSSVPALRNRTPGPEIATAVRQWRLIRSVSNSLDHYTSTPPRCHCCCTRVVGSRTFWDLPTFGEITARTGSRPALTSRAATRACPARRHGRRRRGRPGSRHTDPRQSGASVDRRHPPARPVPKPIRSLTRWPYRGLAHQRSPEFIRPTGVLEQIGWADAHDSMEDVAVRDSGLDQ